MAKVSSVQKEERRRKLVAKHAAKREKLRQMARDESLSQEERFAARLKLAEMPRNSAAVRLHNRCGVTGRPKAYYRKLNMSRIALRELGSAGQVPGLVKSSW